MLNIDIYNQNTIQTLLSLLNQLEADGITDIRFARAAIQRGLDIKALEIKKFMRADTKRDRQRRQSLPRCPSCGKTRLEPWPNAEGLKIVGCRLCRYSAVIGEDR